MVNRRSTIISEKNEELQIPSERRTAVRESGIHPPYPPSPDKSLFIHYTGDIPGRRYLSK